MGYSSGRSDRVGRVMKTMKTAEEIVAELKKYPSQIKWYVVIDGDDGALLVSEYTGKPGDLQGCIELGDPY